MGAAPTESRRPRRARRAATGLALALVLVSALSASALAGQRADYPSLTSMSPTSGPVGTTVTFSGKSLSGVTAIRFHGVTAASTLVLSSTSLRAVVPSGATSGRVSMVTAQGVAFSRLSFTVTAGSPAPPPTEPAPTPPPSEPAPTPPPPPTDPDPTPPPPPPPPSGDGTTLTYTNTFWRCTRPVRDYAVNGLPLRVVMNFTQMYVPPAGAGVVQLGAGCVGDGTNATDLVLDIRGDGRTYGPGDDAVRVMNARPGASNLQIEGRANCGRRVGTAHQDGVQVLGGTNITFRNFEIGNYDAGLATCQGAGGAFFYSLASTNVRVEGGRYIACNHSLFAGNPSGHVTGAMFRSGRTDGTDPVCTGFAASEPCMGPQYGSGVTVYALTCQRWNRSAYRWDAR